MLYLPRGLWSAGIELRLAPGSLLSLGDLGATSTYGARVGRSQQAPPQHPLLAPLLTTMGGRSLAFAVCPGSPLDRSKVAPRVRSFGAGRLGWLPFVASGVH